MKEIDKLKLQLKNYSKEIVELKAELELYENGVYFSSENDKLEIENDKLKEQLEYLRSNEYLKQVKWERNFNEDVVKELQRRIDKAIEYIEQHNEVNINGEIYTGLIEKETLDLLEILKGEYNE